MGGKAVQIILQCFVWYAGWTVTKLLQNRSYKLSLILGYEALCVHFLRLHSTPHRLKLSSLLCCHPHELLLQSLFLSYFCCYEFILKYCYLWHAESISSVVSLSLYKLRFNFVLFVLVDFVYTFPEVLLLDRFHCLHWPLVSHGVKCVRNVSTVVQIYRVHTVFKIWKSFEIVKRLFPGLEKEKKREFAC